jgi:hypothetical protein
LKKSSPPAPPFKKLQVIISDSYLPYRSFEQADRKGRSKAQQPAAPKQKGRSLVAVGCFNHYNFLNILSFFERGVGKTFFPKKSFPHKYFQAFLFFYLSLSFFLVFANGFFVRDCKN